MKKIMSFAIILLPLIALCILSLGGSIINRSTYLFVESIEFVEDSVILDKPTDEDVSKTLQVNVFPMLANNKEVEFWSGDENIVKIDQNGTITSQGFGETYVHVRSKENKTKKASCKVLVTSDRVHRIWVDNEISTIYVGDEDYQLNLKYEPLEASDVALTYSSSQPNVVYVSPNGVLSAKAKGEATITVQLNSNPNVKYSFNISSKVRVENIYIDESSSVLSGLKEFSFPSVHLFPSEAEEKITYSSSDESIASVDQNGKITFLKAGEVTISARVENFDGVIEKTYTSTYGYFSEASFSKNFMEINFEDYQDKSLDLVYSCFPSDGDKTNISFASSDENVIKIEDGQFKVVGGGEVTITLNAKKSKDESINAKITILVKRKADKIETELNDFNYTSLSSLNINASLIPNDSTEKIEYSVSDTSLASIENSKLSFTSKAINNGYAKVRVTLSTSSGAQKTLTIVYVDSSIEKIYLTNQAKLSLVMSKTGQAVRKFALIVEEDVQDIELKLESGDCISQNGCIFTITDKGNASIGVYLNGLKEKTVDIECIRAIEEINNVKVSAIFDSDRIVFNETDKIYSSSKVYEFSYSLYPQNTTKTIVDAQVVGEEAEIVDGKVVFNSAGKVKLVLSADGVSKEVEIESTFAHPDENTRVEENLTISKGQTISLFDNISISPLYADKEFISFQKSGNVLSLENGVIEGLCGGDETIIVNILTSNGQITRQINVHVCENGENVVIVGDEYLFISESNFDLSNKFKVLPETANINNTLTYEVEGDNASIQNKILNFQKEGASIVRAKLNDKVIAKINVVYVKNSIVLSGETQKVLQGTKVVIKPSTEALARAKFDEKFVLDNNLSLLEDEIFITINSDTVVTFSGEQYTIDCVEKIEKISLKPTNDSDADFENGVYVTGLTSISLTGEVKGVDNKYLSLSYSSNSENATITEGGVVTFSGTESVTISLTATYKDVVGGEAKTTSIILQSTLGQITRILPVGNGSYTHIFSETESNVVDVKSYLKVYPSQIVLTSQNIAITSSNTSVASVNGLELTFNKGGEVNIEVSPLQRGYQSGTTLKFLVKRSATDILLDGTKLSDCDEIEIHKSTMLIKTEAFPSDANENCDITFEVISNDDIAQVEGNKIHFKKANESISIKFILGSGENVKEYLINIKTTILTFEVDVESEIYAVPTGELFTFVSTDELTDLQVEFSDNLNINNIKDDVYSISESNVGSVTISYNGKTKVVTFVSTSSLQEITNVKVKDYDANGNLSQIETRKNELSLVTASTSVEVEYDIPTGYDRFGEKIDYSLSVNNSIAQVVDKNKIVFSGEGYVEVSVIVTFKDVEQQKTLTYSFTVQSTYQKVTDFAISKTEYNLIYDNLSQEEKEIDILSTITRISPSYGNVLDKQISSNNESVISILDNKAYICGSGSASVEVTWGKVKKTINFVIDKYIDKINFVDNGKVVSQIVTKENSYKLNYIFTSLNENFKETLTDIKFTTTGNCSIENGNVTLNDENARYEITATALNGGANAKLIIIRVDSLVNVIEGDSNLTNIVIKKGETNIFDFRLEEVVSISSIDENIEFVDSNIQTFKGLKGASGEITLNNGQIINYITTEEVSEIRFISDALQDDYLTAMGDEDNAIDLFEAYGATIYPQSARDENGSFSINYSVKNASGNENIAYIENGKLIFTEQGKVEITFSAGNKVETRTIESTMGYAKNVTFKNNDSLVLEYVDGEYVISDDFYTIYPANAYKHNLTFSSSDGEVFAVSGKTLTFVGVGEANLQLTFNTDENTTSSITKQIYLKNYATDIKFFDEGSQVGYIVKNSPKNSTMSLNYEVISEGEISAYVIKFASSNNGVATIDERGIITFKSNGETIITTTVQEKLDAQNNENNDKIITRSFKLVYREGFDIIKIQDDGATIEFDNEKSSIIYPITNSNISEFEFAHSGSVVSINSFGEITKNCGGEETIYINGKSYVIYVHRKAQIEISIDDIYKNNTSMQDVYTSKNEFDISQVVTFTPSDALARKTIEYISSDTSVAGIENGIIKFKASQNVTIKINVLYNGSVETTKSLVFYSSLGRVESFNISSNNCSLYTTDEIVTISITDVMPKDYEGSTQNLYISSTNTTSYSVTKIDWKTFEISPIKSGKGELIVKYDSESSTIYERISVEIKQWSTSLEIYHNNKAISSLKTFESTVSLNAIVGPTDVTNKLADWQLSVLSGSASIIVDENDRNKVQVVFNDYGSVKLTAKANDGKSEGKEVVIEYVKDIEGFELLAQQVGLTGENEDVKFDENTSNQIAYLEWNQTTITFKISVLPTKDFVGFNDYSNFTITTKNGKTATIDSAGYFTISTDSIETSPIYQDILYVSYSAKYSGNIVIKIERDGLQKIDFGDHNTVKDEECGLQQMRVYGYKSYYNGYLVDYYRMDVNIYNNNQNVATQSDFVDKVEWWVSDSSVTIQEVGNGYVDINFSKISTKNTFDDIYNYDSATSKLTKGLVTIKALNSAGRILCSYTFTVVDGVNIFDQAGYSNAGANIVLQKSFGHTDQQAQIDSGDYVKLEQYADKTTIYGNGHLINLACRNDDSSVRISTGEYACVYFNYVINLKIQGGNYDKSYESYYLQLDHCSKIAYCEAYYMYRLFGYGSGEVSAKKCVLRSFTQTGIILTGSEEDSSNDKVLNLEDIIMFDVGQRAIELQHKSVCNVKGFLDVYNFQDQNALKKLGSIKIGSLELGGSTLAKEIISVAKENGLTVTGGDGGTYANVVGISTKSQNIEMRFYEDGEYVYKEDGSQTQSAPNLKKIKGKKLGVNYCAWAYKSYQDSDGNTIDGAYLTWENEFNADGSLNFAYMSSTTTKISRLGGQFTIE